MLIVKFYKGNYIDRQKQANKDNAVLYVEHHFNSFKRDSNYCMAIIAHNASNKSYEIAKTYCKYVGEEFGIPLYNGDGVKKVEYKERGDYNLRYTKMPAILLEPMFVSNSTHVDILLNQNGIDRLAECLFMTITKHYKNGLIAFSVGHKYKKSNPLDMGAKVVGTNLYEADLAEQVLLKTKELIMSNY